MQAKTLRGKSIVLPANYWAMLLEALALIALGIIMLVWPSITLRVVLVVFGVFAVAFGLFGLADTYRERDEEEYGWLRAALSSALIIVGLLALIWPDATERIILVLLGIWALAFGFMQLAGAFQLPKGLKGKWLVFLIAIISIGVGLYLLVRPQDTSPNEVASVVVRVIGIYAILEGILFTAYAFQLRSFYRKVEKGEVEWESA